MPDTGNPSRRGFLSLASAALGAAAGAIAGLPVIGAMLTPFLRPRPPEAGKFIPVANVQDLETGIPKLVDIVSASKDAWATQSDVVIGTAWLLKRADGSILALSSACPHLGCPVGYSSADRFRCPCHDSYFHFDGSRINGPSERGMDSLDVQVSGNDVLVRYARYRQGTKDKREI